MERHVFDAEYVARLTRGEPETEAHFARYFGQLLTIKLRARVRSPEMAEDIRQDTLLRVIRNLREKNGVEHPERFGAYVNSVCDYVLLEFTRRSGKYQQIPEDAPDPVSQDVDPESSLVTEERKAQVRRVVETLNHKDQQVLRMLFFEARDKDEICRKLGVNRNYLRVRVHRALVHCREALK
jgi:RNA polymerase sigma-70 factor (ECF subfamily)